MGIIGVAIAVLFGTQAVAAYKGVRHTVRSGYALAGVLAAQIYVPLLLLLAYIVLGRIAPDAARSEGPIPGTPRDYAFGVVLFLTELTLFLVGIVLAIMVFTRIHKGQHGAANQASHDPLASSRS